MLNRYTLVPPEGVTCHMSQQGELIIEATPTQLLAFAQVVLDAAEYQS